MYQSIQYSLQIHRTKHYMSIKDQNHQTIEGWRNDDQLQYTSILESPQPIFSVPQQGQQIRKKQKMLPQLAKPNNQKRFDKVVKQRKETESVQNKVIRKVVGSSLEKQLAEIKEKKRRVKHKSSIDLIENIQQKFKKKVIEKEIDDKDIVQGPIYGIKFFKKEKLKKKIKNKKIQSKLKYNQIVIDKKEWWNKILERPEKKIYNLNFSQHTLRHETEIQPKKLPRQLKDRIIEKNQSQRKLPSQTKRNQTFFLNMHKFQTKINNKIDQDLSLRFMDKHLRQHKI